MIRWSGAAQPGSGERSLSDASSSLHSSSDALGSFSSSPSDSFVSSRSDALDFFGSPSNGFGSPSNALPNGFGSPPSAGSSPSPSKELSSSPSPSDALNVLDACSNALSSSPSPSDALNLLDACSSLSGALSLDSSSLSACSHGLDEVDDGCGMELEEEGSAAEVAPGFWLCRFRRFLEGASAEVG